MSNPEQKYCIREARQFRDTIARTIDMWTLVSGNDGSDSVVYIGHATAHWPAELMRQNEPPYFNLDFPIAAKDIQDAFVGFEMASKAAYGQACEMRRHELRKIVLANTMPQETGIIKGA